MLKEQISASLEDYLEAIYKIIEEKHGVKAIEVSRRLGVGRSSVTEALKTLASKKLVNYGRYDVISLTPEGEKAAMKVILKHTIRYEFFTDVLGVYPEDAHENACRVELVISENVLKRFASFIEFNKNFNSQRNDFKKFFEEMNNEKTV